MNQSTQRPNQEGAARVISIAQHRRPHHPRHANEHPLTRRAKLVQATVDEQLQDPHALPIAAAMVILRSDGHLSSVTEAIEPEQIDLFADELENLARRLRAKRRRKPAIPNQRGFARLSSILSLFFLAATYVNESAAVDVALSLAAQLTIAIIARQRN